VSAQRRTLVVLLHVAYWMVYLAAVCLLLAVLRLRQVAPPSVQVMLLGSPVGVAAIVPSALAFALSSGWLFPRFLERRRLGALAVAAVAVATGVAIIGVALVHLLFGERAGPWSADQVAWVAAIALVHITLALVIRGFVGWNDDVAVKRHLSQRARQTELELIAARLSPHFLFNTINNIDVLIEKAPAQASTYLQTLSAVMRFVLYEANDLGVPLSAELGALEQYLSLERLRTSNPRAVRCEVVGSAAGLTIAPMTLLPFVENACKHVSNRRLDDAIVIRVEIARPRVIFECRNTCLVEANPSDGGLGDALIRRRLALLYPNRHALQVTKQHDAYALSLTLDLDDVRLPDH
jgi:two-component system, LytTR family, sensor kinase